MELGWPTASVVVVDGDVMMLGADEDGEDGDD